MYNVMTYNLIEIEIQMNYNFEKFLTNLYTKIYLKHKIT